jgi:hypothetical protein
MAQPEEDDDEVDIWQESREASEFIAGQVAMARLLPLDRLIDACNRADSVGAILDPTGFRAHGRSITAARRIFEATKEWIRKVDEAVKGAERGG